MRFSLFTCILLAAMLVEASCSVQSIAGEVHDFVDKVDEAAHEVIDDWLGEKPGSCIVPDPPTGARLTAASCVGSCNVEPGQKVPVDTALTYSCNEGYSLSGSDVSVCRNGAWDTTVTCIRNCQALRSDTVNTICKRHGTIVSCEYHILPGTTAVLTCKPSLVLPIAVDLGYREINCLDGGIWNLPLFVCRPEFNQTGEAL